MEVDAPKSKTKFLEYTETPEIVYFLRELATAIYANDNDTIRLKKDFIVSLLEESAKRLSGKKCFLDVREVNFRQDVLKEICPDVPCLYGTVNICPKNVDKHYGYLCVTSGKTCNKCKNDYWYEQVKFWFKKVI